MSQRKTMLQQRIKRAENNLKSIDKRVKWHNQNIKNHNFFIKKLEERLKKAKSANVKSRINKVISNREDKIHRNLMEAKRLDQEVSIKHHNAIVNAREMLSKIK